MARGKDHKEVGIFCGALAAAWAQPPEVRGALALAEVIGGAVGGAGGAGLPDILEPATSSYHRKLFHAVVPAGVAIHKGGPPLMGFQAELRAKALALMSEFDLELDPKRRAILFIQAIAMAMFAGIIVGLAAGYASHLALDSLTPRGLPIFC